MTEQVATETEKFPCWKWDRSWNEPVHVRTITDGGRNYVIDFDPYPPIEVPITQLRALTPEERRQILDFKPRPVRPITSQYLQDADSAGI